MFKSTFIMLLGVYCQDKTISAKNNMPHPYNLHDFGFAGNFVGFFWGETIIPQSSFTKRMSQK